MKICQYVVITTATDYHIFFMIDYESNMINDSFAELLAIKCYTTLWNANHKGAQCYVIRLSNTHTLLVARTLFSTFAFVPYLKSRPS